MSTRGVIAVAQSDGWRGIYHGMDSYPTWLGPELWRTYHCYPSLQHFVTNVIDRNPGGLRHLGEPYEDSGCGEMTYTHDDETEFALMIEWVYVLGRRVLTIFTNEPTGEERRRENDTGHWWMEPCYRWVVVCQVPLEGPEPDWQAIEEAAATSPPTPVALALTHRL